VAQGEDQLGVKGSFVMWATCIYPLLHAPCSYYNHNVVLLLLLLL